MVEEETPAAKRWGWGSLLDGASTISRRAKDAAKQAQDAAKQAATAVAKPQELARRLKEKAAQTHQEFMEEKHKSENRGTKANTLSPALEILWTCTLYPPYAMPPPRHLCVHAHGRNGTRGGAQE